MREVALQTPRAELPGFYKDKEFLLGVGNAVGTVKCFHRFSTCAAGISDSVKSRIER